MASASASNSTPGTPVTPGIPAISPGAACSTRIGVASPRTGIVAVLLTQSDPLGPDATRQRAANDDDMMNLLFAAVTMASACTAQRSHGRCLR